MRIVNKNTHKKSIVIFNFAIYLITFHQGAFHMSKYHSASRAQYFYTDAYNRKEPAILCNGGQNACIRNALLNYTYVCANKASNFKYHGRYNKMKIIYALRKLQDYIKYNYNPVKVGCDINNLNQLNKLLNLDIKYGIFTNLARY